MLNALKIDASGSVATGTQSQYWICGSDLLKLVEHALNSINTAANAADGTGKLDDPWVLTGDALTWLNLAKRLRNFTGPACYFYICGRIVKKVAGGYYIVDAGGTNGGGAWDAMPRWGNRGWVWFNFDRGGPSYRNFANYMENVRNNRLSEETWSAGKAQKLRDVLSNDPATSARYAMRGDWTSGQVLPALAATLFLAEPGRNLRSFLANRMLLDMMEAGITYGGRKQGSAPKLYTWKKALLGDSNDQLRGGKSSAANAGSGNAGKVAIAPDGSTPGTANYSQAKEVTLLCRYLTMGRFEGTDEGQINKRASTQILIPGNPPVNTDGDFSSPIKIAGYLKYLMQYTVKTWKL